MTTHRNNKSPDGLDEVLTRFVNAYVQDEKPDLDEFIKQYPQHENQIRRRVEGLCEIDAMFNSLVQADQSDFNGVVTEDNLVGQKIGCFEIVEIIGRGGMGVVYRARDTKLDRTVAVKSIPPEMAGSSTARMRFRCEAKLLASLNHPNIAVIHEIIEEEKSGYLILEYIPGETLAQRLAREPFELGEALSISRQIAEAVSAAHKKGVVHRDLKPGNIKITPEGRVKVLDFGLAKTYDRDSGGSENAATHPGRVIGTPVYMSPEQARGKDTDHRTDIWSFGCLMYQMLTGRLLFEGETATDTLARIIERQPDWEALPKQIPANIRTLLERCLEKDPSRRLEDITEAVQEITETLSTPPQSLLVRLRRMAFTVLVTVVIILSGVAVWFALTNEALFNSKQKRLVVVPFENLGPADDEYFADGITDEITARLAAIRELSVISRQSAMQYKKREKNTRQIAEELGVDYILEGTVQREGSLDPNGLVRIRPQLINASDDVHMWAQIYEKNISEVFLVQSEVAKQVAQALDVTLLDQEKVELESIPTKNMEAWNYYLRGNDYLGREPPKLSLRIAIGMWEKAIELDPQFTLAHTQLSHAFILMYWNHGGSTENIEKAQKHIHTAVALAPDLPEVHSALGHYYYHGRRDYESAFKEFAIVLKSRPNDEKALSWTGWVYKRQGKFEKALEYLKRTYEIGPRNYVYPFHIGLIYELLDRYEQAEFFYDQAISLAPDSARIYNSKMRLYLRQGDTMKARAVQTEFSQYPNVTKDSEIMNTLVEIDVYDKKYQAALDRLSSIPSEAVDNWSDIYPNALRKAHIYEYMDKDDQAKQYYKEVRISLERKIAEEPNNINYQSILGIAYAGLGFKDKAIQAGQGAVKKLPIDKDAIVVPMRVLNLARIYTIVGEDDKAIDQIEYLLSIPGPLSIPLLKLDPAWTPLHNHPRFKKLVDLKQ